MIGMQEMGLMAVMSLLSAPQIVMGNTSGFLLKFFMQAFMSMGF